MVSKRRTREVDKGFRQTIEQVLHCISPDGLFVASGMPTLHGNSRVLNFLTERVRLNTATDERLYLYIEHTYVIDENSPSEPLVKTLGYIYTVYDRDEQRILGFHYHPQGRDEAPVKMPHLHVYYNVDIGGQYLPKLHLPTSRVPLEDVVELLIVGFKVEPQSGYEHEEQGEIRWRKVLREARDIFVRDRHWA